MIYNFDEPVDRRGTSCVKYDLRKEVFGNEDVIPMWVADMDFKTPPFIIEALRKRLGHEILGYTVRREEFFTSIINWLQKRYSWSIEKDWISFSPGVVPAVNMSVLAFTRPGDSIIVQPPVYFPFFPAIEDHERIPVYNQLVEGKDGWRFDFDDLEEKASAGARMLILSNPHNPVGRAWTAGELNRLASICLKHNVIILSDEIHSDLVLPGHSHTPVASLSAAISDITLTCMAPSKTFNLAGMSTSSLIIPNSELRGKYNAVMDKLHIGMGNLMGTEASVAAYSEGEEWLMQLLDYLATNIEFVIEFCRMHLPEIKPVKPEATYMIWLDCREMGMKPDELKSFFIEKAGLGLNEGSAFGIGGEGFMRMNIACPLATVEVAMNRLLNAYKDLKR